jgi:hypothetical protein
MKTLSMQVIIDGTILTRARRDDVVGHVKQQIVHAVADALIKEFNTEIIASDDPQYGHGSKTYRLTLYVADKEESRKLNVVMPLIDKIYEALKHGKS